MLTIPTSQSDHGGIPTDAGCIRSVEMILQGPFLLGRGHGEYGQESGTGRARGMRSRKAVESWATENWSRHALFCLTGPGDNVLQEALSLEGCVPLSIQFATVALDPSGPSHASMLEIGRGRPLTPPQHRQPLPQSPPRQPQQCEREGGRQPSRVQTRSAEPVRTQRLGFCERDRRRGNPRGPL